MSTLNESEELGDPEFKWVEKGGVGGKNKATQFYKSLTYDGVDYALHDCVYMYKQGEPAPYIGKLVKMWETAEGLKRIKVQWFFRPSEISFYLKDAEVLENELFFASGEGKGLANLNPPEAIAGKCNVVCTSKDSRNLQPSAEELEMADYVFHRIFDVKSCTISDQMGDKVGGLEVNFVFNRREGAMILDGPKLDSNEKYERNVVQCNETPKIAVNNSSQQLNNKKLDKNGNHALEDVTLELVQESLIGKYSSSADVVSSRNSEITDTTLEERDTMGGKNVESNISEKKDKFEDMKLLANQVQVEKGVKHARESCDLDDAPSKRAKFDGSVSSDLIGLQGLTISRKDSFVFAEDKMLGENLSSLGEKPCATNVVSHYETLPLSSTNASPKTSKSIPNKEFNVQPEQNLSTSSKKPLEIHTKESMEKSNPGNMSHENKDKRLASNSYPKDEGYPKKAKLDNSIKRSEENKNNNNNNKKLEKLNVGETKSLPKVTTFGDHNAKSRLGEGTSKEYRNENEKKHFGGLENLPLTSRDNKAKSKVGERPSKEYHNEANGKRFNDKLPISLATKSKDGDGDIGGKIIEVTRRPHEKASWMKFSWEQQMKIAHDQGRLVLLQNLDPEYTSGEVEDIIWYTVGENCTARMVPHTAISNPYSGQALVVFKSKDAADKVVRKLEDRCLMLPNQRPLVARHGVLPKLSEMKTAFPGHLVIDRARRQTQRDMKDAVSTSHMSQHNTIEFEMAMDWCTLQAKSDKWWEKLYELQEEELKKLTENLQRE